MILVFIILGIIIIINLITLILILSNLKVEISKLYISNVNSELKVELIINISIYAFNKIKIINVNIDKEKITNFLNSSKFDIRKLRNNKEVNRKIYKALKEDNFTIEKIEFNGYFSTFNTVLSSILYTIVNAILPILIANKVESYDSYINNIRFLNINENIINIHIDCIINVKIVNIINILYSLKKKGGNKENGKSSNRRTYAYCNE